MEDAGAAGIGINQGFSTLGPREANPRFGSSLHSGSHPISSTQDRKRMMMRDVQMCIGCAANSGVERKMTRG